MLKKLSNIGLLLLLLLIVSCNLNTDTQTEAIDLNILLDEAKQYKTETMTTYGYLDVGEPSKDLYFLFPTSEYFKIKFEHDKFAIVYAKNLSERCIGGYVSVSGIVNFNHRNIFDIEADEVLYFTKVKNLLKDDASLRDDDSSGVFNCVDPKSPA